MFDQSREIFARREFTRLRKQAGDRVGDRGETERQAERGREKWPGFCIADPVYTLETQGRRAGVQRWQALPLGERTRPPGLPRKIRRVHGGAQRLFLGPLGAVQKLYQGAPASARAAEVAGTVTPLTLSRRTLVFLGGEGENDRLPRRIDAASCLSIGLIECAGDNRVTEDRSGVQRQFNGTNYLQRRKCDGGLSSPLPSRSRTTR